MTLQADSPSPFAPRCVISRESALGATLAAITAAASSCVLSVAPQGRAADVPPGAAAQVAISASGAVSPSASAGDSAAEALRIREGTQFTDRLGHFRQQGESIVFVDDQGRQLGGLPNLNLERIARMLKAADEPESVSWSVSGMVTEFGGRNYLLITRAVYKSATLPPAPDLIE